MRKMNPAGVKNDFITSLTELDTFYTTTSAVLTLASQRTFLTENSMLAAAVLWEGFISDLLVAYINRDSTRFSTHLRDALRHGLSDKQDTILTKYARLNIPAHLNKAEIQELVDANGNNITFSHFGALVDQTKSWLVPIDADRFRLRNQKEKSVINSLIAIRNHLAHRSERSHNAMNDALGVGALQPVGLKRGQKKINSVGPYLKTIAPGKNVTRLELFINELKIIAALL